MYKRQVSNYSSLCARVVREANQARRRTIARRRSELSRRQFPRRMRSTRTALRKRQAMRKVLGRKSQPQKLQGNLQERHRKTLMSLRRIQIAAA